MGLASTLCCVHILHVHLGSASIIKRLDFRPAEQHQREIEHAGQGGITTDDWPLGCDKFESFLPNETAEHMMMEVSENIGKSNQKLS